VISVIANLTILLGALAFVGAALSLPGIAGLILTIGMGVDSNVLIFERIKEELKAGRPARSAMRHGFDRVLLTILDTHVASLIAAAFLFQFGTGAIRGFATTLTLGLLANVFTAVVVSRTLFEISLSRTAGAGLGFYTRARERPAEGRSTFSHAAGMRWHSRPRSLRRASRPSLRVAACRWVSISPVAPRSWRSSRRPFRKTMFGGPYPATRLCSVMVRSKTGRS
jgi:predicted RND superfamily exporter protein